MYRCDIINDELLIMNQTIRIILATILVALSYTGSANADAQQKFSFQGVSYNGDIKPEQFSFSDVMIKARSNTDRVYIKVIFQDVSTPYKASDKEETVDITFEGDPKSETVYALRLSYGTFSQTIPSTYSYEGKSSRFLISPRSIQDGKFNSLYEQLTAHDKTKIKGVCNYFLDDNNIEEIISLQPSSSTKIIGKGFGNGVAGKEIGAGKGATRISKLLSNPDVPKQIRTLASLCTEATERVYVKDVQTFLNASGHDVGKSDGQWGPKSQKGWEAYLSSQDKPLDTTISSNTIQALQENITGKIPKLRETMFKDGYFDLNGELSKHVRSNGHICKFVPCKLTIKEKLKNRKTVNLFSPWGVYYEDGKILKEVDDYKSQLFWRNRGNLPKPNFTQSNSTIVLEDAKWMFEYKQDMVKELSKYYHSRPLIIPEYRGQRDRYSIKIMDKSYPAKLSEVLNSEIKLRLHDGFAFDWWHDYLERFQKGVSQTQIKRIRLNIASELRKKLGPNKLIIGNTNYKDDISTHKYINGIYMEVSSKGSHYNNSEISKIEKLMHRHNKHLQEPKILLLKVDKIYKQNQPIGWNDPENRKAAKLFSAMSVVISDNGYFLYEMGGKEMKKKYPGRQGSISFPYDFYNFDIGKPTSGYNKVKSGVGYKEHDRGFIAYNITGSSKKFKRKNGQEHTIEAKSGLFCKDVGAKTECLSNN